MVVTECSFKFVDVLNLSWLNLSKRQWVKLYKIVT
ncbi:hypothetical protein BD01_1090 [Thermococcus nautili]|uniref:Uncharacterized protein n=1 Tax=Thermococcus nautili TaxID=195522 RepID=W8NUB9_9EURY|nr:hypothetical protein BD01_1090 [Thermococcus nautili]